jgi:hypothetical protein
MRKIQSETDKNYIDAGVLTPEEIAASRFAGDNYSLETKLLTDRSDPSFTEIAEGRKQEEPEVVV